MRSQRVIGNAVDKKRNWFAQTELLINTECPELRGRLDWSTITHLYNQGDTPENASLRYITLHKEQLYDAQSKEWPEGKPAYKPEE